jgi:TraX protein
VLSIVQTTAPSLHAAPLGYTDGQLETLKWIALASMFLDHFGRHLLGFGQDTWVFALGRVAFPLFELVLALNLAREGDRAARSARTARRLGVWCAVAVLPSIWARGDPMVLNVLGTLALGAALCWTFAGQARTAVRLAICVVAAVASDHVEFGLPGVFLIPAIYLWTTQRQPRIAALAVLLLLMTGWLNMSLDGMPAMLGTLAAAPIAWAVRQLPITVPRLRLAFYLVYPLHLALIGALKATD